MQSGDLDNAILVLTKADEANKNNTEIQKDLALAYYYKKDYSKALETVKLALDSPDCDALPISLPVIFTRHRKIIKKQKKVIKTV